MEPTFKVRHKIILYFNNFTFKIVIFNFDFLILHSTKRNPPQKARDFVIKNSD